jgi:serine/threonine protein kinase
MTTVQQATPKSRQAGAEPIPGYRLLEPLGQGGFGEVWKCEAPGGVFKAIKFVTNGEEGAGPATQELEALQRVKTLRHPFILSLDRLEVIDDVLLIIMELADQSLQGLYSDHHRAGHVGIPRDELLGYLLEVAEALDWMNFEHGLQHLDIKPHNLFLVSNHVKVADFGLVTSLGDERGVEPVRAGGMTPMYSAPELLRGSLSRHSDQYSLAVVYQQLLTGTLPFWHPNIYELMMQHLSASPELAALPGIDQPLVRRALSKVPEQRFPSCMEFIHALLGSGSTPSPGLRRSGAWRRVPIPPRSDSAAASGPARPSAVDQPTQVVPITPSRDEPPALMPLLPPPGAPARPPMLTALSLPGYRFLSCLMQGPLGEVWRAEDSAGRPRRAFCLLNFVRYDARLIHHLQALHDPALPPTEVHWSPAERLVILTECSERTLRDRFEECLAEGRPGVPRAELLRLLRSAAEALDALHERHGLQHLGIHPRNLLIEGDRLWITEFGVVPLVWLPTGQSAATANGRYAAPELTGRRPTRTADQYSLALIYAEMLTGVNPRPQRAGPAGSGAFRRPGAASARATGVNRSGRLDVDLLPANDRDVVLKALCTEPERRFESCTAFVEALEQAGREKEPPDPCLTLPQVIPYASLLGEPAGPSTVLPDVERLVHDLIKPPEPRVVPGPSRARCSILPDGSWEFRFPLQLFPGAMKLKVEGFRQQWQARVVQKQGDSYRLQLDVEVPRSFWQRCVQAARRVEVDIRVDPMLGPQTRLTEASVRVLCPGRQDEQTSRLLASLAPRLFESVRVYFQASQEQRTRERWSLSESVHVYPVLPELDLAEMISGVSQNISYGGVRIRLPQRPPTNHLYLHFHQAQAALGYAILARVARVQETDEGVELGALFPGALA